MNSPVAVQSGPDAGALWHRGDPFGEQKLLEAGRAMVALPGRTVVSVTGADRASWLHSLTTGVFNPPTPGKAIQALVLGPTAHVRHGLLALDDGEQTWLLGASPTDQSLGGYLDSMRFRMKVEVTEHPELVALWVGEHLDDAPTAVIDGLDAGVDGGRVRIVAGSELSDGDDRLAGLWAWEALRLAAGIPRIGRDTDDKTLPNELGLFATALDKGCYTGQETVARVNNIGRPPRRLARLLLDGSMDRLPAEGAEIMLGGEPVGRVGTSAAHYDQGPLALGLLRRSVPVAASLVVDGDIAAAQEAIVDPDIGLHFTSDPALRRRKRTL